MKTYLQHKDGTEQEVMVIYPIKGENGELRREPPYFMEDGDKIYKEPMTVVQVKGVPIEKPWSIKTVPMRFVIERDEA